MAKEKKYEVVVTRTVSQTMTILVPATSVEQAKDLAVDYAGNTDFSGCEKESEYEVDEVRLMS